MILDLNGDALCINCDWLQWSVRLVDANPELECPDGYRLELLQGNNVYRNRGILYDEQGRKWLTFLWSPYSSVLDPYVMTVQASNWLLYCDLGGSVMDVLQSVVDCEFNSMGRVDICCDFQMNNHIMEILKHLNSGHYYVQGKKAGSSWWHVPKSAEVGFFHKELHCQTWGSATSEIKWKIYFKSLEINAIEDCDKPWIRDEWTAAGLDVANVWRIEVSLCGACCLRWDDKLITISNALSGAWLTNVFGDMLEHRFVVRINQGRRDGHKNNDARVPLFPMPWSSIHLAWARPRDVPEASAAVVSVRRLLRCLDDAPTRCNPAVFNAVANSVLEIVEAEHLERYFESRFGCECEAYLNQLAGTVGLGIVDAIDPPSRSFD